MAKQLQKPDLVTDSTTQPGFFRYLAAIFYDLVLVIALFFIATAILLPFNQGEAIKSTFIFPFYLLSISFVFYGWFWTHGGQTLGLRAWKLRVISDMQTDITWKQALIRYLTACFSWLILALGIFWRLWHKDKKTWQDLSSHSSIIFIEKSQSLPQATNGIKSPE